MKLVEQKLFHFLINVKSLIKPTYSKTNAENNSIKVLREF